MRVSIELATSAVDRSIYIWGELFQLQYRSRRRVRLFACLPVNQSASSPSSRRRVFEVCREKKKKKKEKCLDVPSI